jgi:hypothetical protein
MPQKAKKRTLKAILKLPGLEHSKTAVLNSLPSLSSRRSYDHAIRDFIDWYFSEPRLAFNRTIVTRYRIAPEQCRYASFQICCSRQRQLHRQNNHLVCSQPQIIVHRDLDVLLGTQILLRGLDRRVTEQEFDLLKIPATLPTQFRASPPEVVGAEVLDPDLLR